MSSRRRRGVRDEDDCSDDNGPADSSSESEEEIDSAPAPAVRTDLINRNDSEVIPKSVKGKRGNRVAAPDNSDVGSARKQKEIRKNPAFVPRGGQFFLHDNRQDNNNTNKDEPDDRNKKPDLSLEPKRGSESTWRHDKFDVNIGHEENDNTDRPKKANKNKSHRNKSSSATPLSSGERVAQDSCLRQDSRAVASAQPQPVTTADRKELGTRVQGPTPHGRKPKQQNHPKQQKKISSVSMSGNDPNEAYQESKPQLSAPLKADAAEFNPSPGKPTALGVPYPPVDISYSDAVPVFSASKHNYRGTRRENPYYDASMTVQSVGFVPGDVGTVFGVPAYAGNNPAIYPTPGYSNSMMYAYDGNHLGGDDGYYPNNYGGYAQGSGGVVYGATPTAALGTVYFPTTPSVSSDQVSSPSVYNGTQYFPTSPASIYYDQSYQVGDHRKGYKSRHR